MKNFSNETKELREESKFRQILKRYSWIICLVLLNFIGKLSFYLFPDFMGGRMIPGALGHYLDNFLFGIIVVCFAILFIAAIIVIMVLISIGIIGITSVFANAREVREERNR